MIAVNLLHRLHSGTFSLLTFYPQAYLNRAPKMLAIKDPRRRKPKARSGCATRKRVTDAACDISIILELSKRNPSCQMR